MGLGIEIMTGIGIIGNETVDGTMRIEVQEDRVLELQRVSTDFYDSTRERLKQFDLFRNFPFLSYSFFILNGVFESSKQSLRHKFRKLKAESSQYTQQLKS